MGPFSFRTERRAGVAALASRELLPGWYGKLPALGDFAARRMPPPFQHTWDAWLSAGLAAWQRDDPAGWLAAYLAAPSWRFLMPRGHRRAGDADPFAAVPAWCGVLMPSVDRVGRYFPFTLVRPLARLPGDATEARTLLGWLDRADDLAADALHHDWSVERLEAALATLADATPDWFADVRWRRRAMPWPRRGAAPGGRDGAAADDDRDGDDTVILDAGAETVILATEDGADYVPGRGADLAAVLGAIAATPRDRRAIEQVWWFCADAIGAMHLRTTHGLPEGADFARLMSPPRPTGAA